MRKMGSDQRFGVFLILLAVAAITGSCDLLPGGQSGPTPGPVVRPSPAPRQDTPTPAPTSTPEATATPEAKPNLTLEQARELVFQLVRPCADQITRSREAAVEVTSSPFFRREDGYWTTQASSEDGSLSFGNWKIVDATGEVTSLDEVALAIMSADTVCENPVSLQAGGFTPPLILTSTPAPSPMPTPTATPTSVSNLTVVEVQQLIFQMVRQCADFVSLSMEDPVQVAFATVYDPATATWTTDATSEDESLNLGRWQVTDATAEVAPLDDVAISISPSDVTCGEPVAALSTGLTPPIISAPPPTPTPTPTATPSPVVSTAQQAALRVWVNVFNCYDHFPDLENFTAYPDDVGRWIVEGSSAITHYGLWQVNTLTGEISPSDLLAKEAATFCGFPAEATFPAAVTAEQAELLVWISSYDCFDTKPNTTSFTAYQDNPRRWLVEGKEGVVYYGMWMVDTSTATIDPWDDVSREAKRKECYREP